MENMSAILIQYASGDHLKLLDATEGWHRAYCDEHQIDYLACRIQRYPERSPHWERIPLLLEALRSGYYRVFWLDADCLIGRRDVDLRTALSDDPSDPRRGLIGMVRHSLPNMISHFNTGAIYLKNDPRVIRLLESAWSKWPAGNDWEDQVAINQALFEHLSLLCEEMPTRWNHTPHFPDQEKAVVMAWHGCGDAGQRRIEIMKILRSLSPGK